MKRLLQILTFTWLLATILTGCYNYDDIDTIESEVDILSCFKAEGKAWLNLEIPLGYPSTTTRATTFDDGADAEYAVHNVMIVLFHGTGEADAEVASTYNFTWTESMDATAQVTKRLQVKSDNIEKGDNIYLLAILNASPTIAANTSFSDLMDNFANITTTDGSTTYFVMANAPLATANNGTGTVQTLVQVSPMFFFATEDEAKANPAAHVYVERAAAKVSVGLGDIPTVTNGSYTDYYVKGNPNLVFTDQHLADYSIYNYNTQSYLVRHFNATNWLSLHRDGSSDYRFVEPQPLPYGDTRYRTYWATDANYSSDMTNNAVKGWKEMGESDYCAENTMNLEHMDIKNSTLVLVKLNLNNYTSFYTTSVTGSDIIYQLPTNPDSEEGTSAKESFARQLSSAASRRATKTSDTHYYVSSARTIDEYLREWLMQTNTAARNWVNTYAAGDANRIIITLEDGSGTKPGPTGGGRATVKCTQKARTSGQGVTDFTALGLDTYFANNITVNYYENGYCYYLVPIMHFGDTQTPWQSAASMTGSTASAAYGTNNAAYLGRYGVVRNNWYNILITGVSHVGSCNAAQLFAQMSDQADDTVEQLLNAMLNISPWTTNNIPLTPPTP